MRVHWSPGMRAKMPFETENLSRISRFIGTIASVKVADPIRWPNSPWRLLQVTWDEPEMLQNVKCVSPWLVEVIPNTLLLHMPLTPPRKKLRLPHQHQDISLDSQFPIPSFSLNPLRPNSPLSHISNDIIVGIQGARHAPMGVPLSDLHLSSKPHIGLLPANFMRLDDPRASRNVDGTERINMDGNENVSCLLSIGNRNQKLEKTNGVKTPVFVLFGQPILTEQQMSRDNWKTDNSAHVLQDFPKSLLTTDFLLKMGPHEAEIHRDSGRCRVFLESEDVGWTLDLFVLGSYEELYRKLEHMLGLERLEMKSHLLYHDAMGAAKQAGEEPFSEFMKSAKRLTILMKPSGNNAKWKLITGLPTAEHGLDSSNQAPLSIFA